MMLHYQIWGCILSLLLSSTSAECKPISAQEYLNRIKAAVESRDTVTISENVQTLCKKYPGSSVTLVALLLEGNFAQDVSGDSKHAKVCYEKIASSDERSTVVAAGRIALADMAWHGAFKKSIADYEAILKDFPDLPLYTRMHIYAQLGLFHWQLRDKDNARANFLQVINSRNGGSATDRKIATTYIDAFNSSQSIAMMLALYERAMRWRDSHINRDLCWRDLSQFLKLAKQPFFEQYCINEKVDNALRAALLYKLALAEFEMGNHDVIQDITQRALALKPADSTKQKLLYLQAYHHGHCHHYGHAAMLYREILNGPVDAEVTPNAYWALVKMQKRQQNRTAAHETIDEFCALYPYRVEVRKFRALKSHDQKYFGFSQQKSHPKHDGLSLELRKNHQTPLSMEAMK